MDITLPELGENVEEAEVLNVLVRKGDAVTKDQPLLELETDKSTFELPSPEAGTVSAIHVKPGDTVRVGQKILALEAGAPARSKSDRTKPKDDEPEREEPKAEAKQKLEDERKPEAKRRQPEKPEKTQTPEAVRAAEKAEKAEEKPEPRQKPEADAEGDVEPAAGPAARRLARESKVDLTRIRGTGSGGRITPEDVQAFVREHASTARTDVSWPGPRTAPGSESTVEDERWGPVERRKLTGIEQTAARHLSASWTEIPHVTHHDYADVTELEEARRRYEAGRKDSEPKLTWTALVVKAVVAGLRAFPKVNSNLDAEQEELVLKKYVHVGIAVDTEHGLLVPVLRDADRKTTRKLAAEIAALAERARARKLGREEMQGASFTVTNLGGIGGVAFTPIVSRPEVAILGVSRNRDELSLRDGQVVRRILLPLSLSYDHRVVNGADAARFVRYVADLLEDPLRLLMES